MSKLVIRYKSLGVSQLRIVNRAPPPDDPPLRIGDVCRLNSGGPEMLVVDILGTKDIVVAWKSDLDSEERRFPRACVRRTNQS